MGSLKFHSPIYTRILRNNIVSIFLVHVKKPEYPDEDPTQLTDGENLATNQNYVEFLYRTKLQAQYCWTLFKTQLWLDVGRKTGSNSVSFDCVSFHLMFAVSQQGGKIFVLNNLLGFLVLGQGLGSFCYAWTVFFGLQSYKFSWIVKGSTNILFRSVDRIEIRGACSMRRDFKSLFSNGFFKDICWSNCYHLHAKLKLYAGLILVWDMESLRAILTAESTLPPTIFSTQRLFATSDGFPERAV